MALLMLEGFDHYAIPSRMALKGWIGAAFAGQQGRFPYAPQTQAAKVILFNAIFKALPAITQDLVAGFAFQVEDLHASSLMTLKSQTLGNAVSVGIDDFGHLTVDDGTTLLTGSSTILPNTWYYIELKLDSGTAELHLNEQFVEIPSTGGDFSHDWYLVQFEWGGGFGAHFLVVDDFYLCDLTGDVNNDFLGEIVVETLYPVSDGTYTDWTPDSGADHFARVNEHQIDEMTSYVKTAGAGDKDTYGIGDPEISADAPILGIQLNLGVTKLDAGVRTIEPLIRQAGTDYTGPTRYATTDWGFVSWLLDVDPSGSPWDATTLMADEYGIEVVT